MLNLPDIVLKTRPQFRVLLRAWGMTVLALPLHLMLRPLADPHPFQDVGMWEHRSFAALGLFLISTYVGALVLHYRVPRYFGASPVTLAAGVIGSLMAGFISGGLFMSVAIEIFDLPAPLVLPVFAAIVLGVHGAVNHKIATLPRAPFARFEPWKAASMLALLIAFTVFLGEADDWGRSGCKYHKFQMQPDVLKQIEF